MTISMDKQYRTRDGREVRIYALDGDSSECRVHGAIKWDQGWVQHNWHETGFYYDNKEESLCDLIEIKPRIQREMWLNVYEEDWKFCIAAGYSTKAAADLVAPPSRIACVKVVIDCEEGEGL